MAKEQFTIDESREILNLIELAGGKAGVARGHAFEDFLTLVVCALAGQTMEEEYLAVVRKGYDQGTKGKRGIDDITKAFARMVNVMDEKDADVLGDIFQGGITYGESGQFFTPASLTDLMSSLVTGKSHQPNLELEMSAEAEPPDDDIRIAEDFKSVCDPACGSGRILLSIGKEHRNWELTGQDIDQRCVKMTAINLGLNGLHGWAVWQNSLTLETFKVYKVGLNLHGGVIREVPVELSPFNYMAMKRNQETPNKAADPKPSNVNARPTDDKLSTNNEETNNGPQLGLF